jgi:hypothetical protein
VEGADESVEAESSGAEEERGGGEEKEDGIRGWTVFSDIARVFGREEAS